MFLVELCLGLIGIGLTVWALMFILGMKLSTLDEIKEFFE